MIPTLRLEPLRLAAQTLELDRVPCPVRHDDRYPFGTLDEARECYAHPEHIRPRDSRLVQQVVERATDPLDHRVGVEHVLVAGEFRKRGFELLADVPRAMSLVQSSRDHLVAAAAKAAEEKRELADA